MGDERQCSYTNILLLPLPHPPDMVILQLLLNEYSELSYHAYYALKLFTIGYCNTWCFFFSFFHFFAFVSPEVNNSFVVSICSTSSHPLPTAGFSTMARIRGNLPCPVGSPGVIPPGDFHFPPAWTRCSLCRPFVIPGLHFAAVFKIPCACLRSAGFTVPGPTAFSASVYCPVHCQRRYSTLAAGSGSDCGGRGYHCWSALTALGLLTVFLCEMPLAFLSVGLLVSCLPLSWF